MVESLVRYRLLSEPELSNLLKKTLSNGSLQSTKCQLKSKDEPENATSADFDLKENLIKEQKSPRQLATDKNDNNSQSRHNNNLMQTSWDVFSMLSIGWLLINSRHEFFAKWKGIARYHKFFNNEWVRWDRPNICNSRDRDG